MTKFEENLEYAFSESKDELSMQHRETNKEYKQREKEYYKLFYRIEALLGDNKKLMRDFEVLGNEIEAIETEYIYLQGMIDCVILLKKIKMF